MSSARKHQAHAAVARAIREGRLVRQPCEICGGTPTDGHHDDYSKALDVRWLCRSHHRQLHGAWLRVGRGRNVTALVPNDEAQALARLARENDRTTAAELRVAIRAYISTALRQEAGVS